MSRLRWKNVHNHFTSPSTFINNNRVHGLSIWQGRSLYPAVGAFGGASLALRRRLRQHRALHNLLLCLLVHRAFQSNGH